MFILMTFFDPYRNNFGNIIKYSLILLKYYSPIVNTRKLSAILNLLQVYLKPINYLPKHNLF